MSHPRLMRLIASSVVIFGSAADAIDIVKDNNTSALNLGAAWAGGIAPTAAESGGLEQQTAANTFLQGHHHLQLCIALQLRLDPDHRIKSIDLYRASHEPGNAFDPSSPDVRAKLKYSFSMTPISPPFGPLMSFLSGLHLQSNFLEQMCGHPVNT